MISTEKAFLGEYSARKAVAFHTGISHFKRAFLLVFRLLFRYNGTRKSILIPLSSIRRKIGRRNGLETHSVCDFKEV